MASSTLLVSLPAALLLYAVPIESFFSIPIPKLSLTAALCLVFPLLHFALFPIILELSLRRRAKAKGAIIPKRIQGWLPGNIDLGRKIFREMNTTEPGVALEKLRRRYGPVYMLPSFGQGMVVTAEPEHMQKMLATNFKNFGKSSVTIDSLKDFLGIGIFASDQKSLWSYHRHLTRPHFSQDETFNLPRLLHHSEKFIDYFIRKGKEGKAVDAQDIFGRFTMDSGTEMFFGSSIGSLIDLEAVEEGREPPNQSDEFVNAFLEAQIVAQKRLRDITQTWKIFSFFSNPIDPHMKVIVPRIQKLVDEAMESKAKGDDERTVYIHSLLNDTQDRKLIQDELLNILLAARDTTSNLLSSVIFELGKRPDVVEKLRLEIKGTLQDDPSRVPEQSEVKEMRYLRAVIHETLRVWPPVYVNGRSAFEDDVFTVDDKRYFIPKGWNIRYLIGPMQRSTKWWGPDAETWDPERWLDDRIKYMTSNPFIFQPFSAGPRICLGQKLALNTASFALVRLLQRVSTISFAKDAQPPESILPNGDISRWQGFVMSFKGGVWVRFGEGDLEN